jgi:hypothetical protein
MEHEEGFSRGVDLDLVLIKKFHQNAVRSMVSHAFASYKHVMMWLRRNGK